MLICGSGYTLRLVVGLSCPPAHAIELQIMVLSLRPLARHRVEQDQSLFVGSSGPSLPQMWEVAINDAFELGITGKSHIPESFSIFFFDLVFRLLSSQAIHQLAFSIVLLSPRRCKLIAPSLFRAEVLFRVLLAIGGE